MEAGLELGEIYKASFNPRGLGTRWWAFGSEEEFKGLRLSMWRDVKGGSDKPDGDREAQVGEMGEKPQLLDMIVERNGVDIEIV